jgi:hypothetical protein
LEDEALKTKKPLPEKRLMGNIATVALIFQKFTSAGIGTENWTMSNQVAGAS